MAGAPRLQTRPGDSGARRRQVFALESMKLKRVNATPGIKLPKNGASCTGSVVTK